MSKKKTDLEARLKKTLSEIFEIGVSDIDEEFHIDNVPIWDSLKHLNLVAGIEREFGISIELGHVIIMVSYQSIMNILEEYDIT